MRPITFHLLPFFLISIAMAELNCHGSARCFGHHGREDDIITIITNQMPSTATFSSTNFIACTSFGSNGLKGAGDWGFCNMLRNTGGETFGKTKILALLKGLKNAGKCNPCGSIPTGWPEDNSTAGHLTENFVYSIPGVCLNSFCSSLADQPDGTIPKLPAGYAPGSCLVHFTQYQKKNPIATDASGHYHFDFNIKDADSVDIGDLYYQEAPPGVQIGVSSLLPNDLQVWAGQTDADPVRFSYPGNNDWDSSSLNCETQGYAGGQRGGSCKFAC